MASLLGGRRVCVFKLVYWLAGDKTFNATFPRRRTHADRHFNLCRRYFLRKESARQKETRVISSRAITLVSSEDDTLTAVEF